MKKIDYIITDPLGIHARPAGLLVKSVSEFKCTAKITAKSKEVDARRIMGVMGLGVKPGDKITITFEGEDEAAAAQKVGKFLSSML